MNKKTYTRDTSKPFDDSDIDYSVIDKMTDDEVHEGALSDKDAQPVTDEQIEDFKRANPKKRDKKND